MFRQRGKARRLPQAGAMLAGGILVLLVMAISGEAIASASTDRSVLTKNILHQKLKIVLAPGTSRLAGEQSIIFRATREDSIIVFDTGPVTVSSASFNGIQLTEWRKTSSGLEFALPEMAAVGTNHELSITYEASPRRGFWTSSGMTYTGYFACDWMICDQEAFDDRFTAEIRIVAPAGMTTLGPGTLEAVSKIDEGLEPNRKLIVSDFSDL